jgi:hypothetical protein
MTTAPSGRARSAPVPRTSCGRERSTRPAALCGDSVIRSRVSLSRSWPYRKPAMVRYTCAEPCGRQTVGRLPPRTMPMRARLVTRQTLTWIRGAHSCYRRPGLPMLACQLRVDGFACLDERLHVTSTARARCSTMRVSIGAPSVQNRCGRCAGHGQRSRPAWTTSISHKVFQSHGRVRRASRRRATCPTALYRGWVPSYVRQIRH